jgi:hypothetical protein
VPDRLATAAVVHDALRILRPLAFADGPPADDVALGDAGMALYSIEIVEVLLDAADRLRVSGDRLVERLDTPPERLGELIDLLAAL